MNEFRRDLYITEPKQTKRFLVANLCKTTQLESVTLNGTRRESKSFFVCIRKQRFNQLTLQNVIVSISQSQLVSRLIFFQTRDTDPGDQYA